MLKAPKLQHARHVVDGLKAFLNNTPSATLTRASANCRYLVRFWNALSADNTFWVALTFH